MAAPSTTVPQVTMGVGREKVEVPGQWEARVYDSGQLSSDLSGW